MLSLDTVSRRDDRGGTGMTTSGGGPVERMLAGPPGGGSDTVVAESADAAGLRNAFLTQLHIRRAVIFRPDATSRGVCWPVARIFR